MSHDFEYYLAYPLRYLAKWCGVEYNGEFRNGQVAHCFAGWALMLTLLKLWWPLSFVCVAYPILREAEDSKWFKEWNRKSWVDLFTFWMGEGIGAICWLATS